MPRDTRAKRVDVLGRFVHRRLALGGATAREGGDRQTTDRERFGGPVAPRFIAGLVRDHDPLAGAAVVEDVVDHVLDRMCGLGPLEPILADPRVTEVMINGPGQVWVEREGHVGPTNLVVDRSTVEHLIERIVTPLGLRVDRTSPLVDARLADGSRVNAIVPPLAVDGPYLTIRRFRTRAIPLVEMCPPGVAEMLAWAVRARLNVLVSGGTATGKTTLLNALAAEIPGHERVITVEDAAELRLPGEHVVRLEARPANAEGVGAITPRTLVRNALRMRPDRIIVGECRGPEALDVLQAMNTGHEGSLSTCHANSPADALRRLETMVLMGDVALPLTAVREHLVAALDLVVHVARGSDAARRVVEVGEVVDLGPPVTGTTATSGAPAERIRLLADEAGLRALPERPARSTVHGAAGPNRRWLGPALPSLVLGPSLALGDPTQDTVLSSAPLVALAFFALLALAVVARARLMGAPRQERSTSTWLAPWRADTVPWTPRRLAVALRRAGLRWPPSAVWLAWLTGTAVSTLIGGLLGGVGLAVAAGAVTVAAPLVVLSAAQGRGDQRFEAALPLALENTARALRSGSSLRAAMGEAARDAPVELDADLARIVDAADQGVPLLAAIEMWAVRRPLPGVRLAVAALALGVETGGPTARSLDGVASTLRDRVAARREALALATQARLSALVVAVAPIGLALVAAATDRSTAQFLLGTPIGLSCLGAGLTLDAVAALWMARLTRTAR